MSQARVAVSGCGGHATRNTLPSLRLTEMDLVAACDIDEAAARRCAKRFGAPRVVSDCCELLDPDEVDGVLVDASLHDKIAIDALRAGLHVFTETPPSMTAAESLVVARAAKQSGKICMTAFTKRYAPAYVEAQRIIAEEMPPGERHMEYTYSLSHYNTGVTDPARAFLLDAGIHAVDAVRFFMGRSKKCSPIRRAGLARNPTLRPCTLPTAARGRSTCPPAARQERAMSC